MAGSKRRARWTVTFGVVAALMLPGLATAAVPDCPPGATPLASAIPAAGKPAPRLAMLRAKPKAAKRPSVRAKPRAYAKATPAKVKRKQVAKARRAKPRQLAVHRPRPAPAKVARPTPVAIAAANVAAAPLAALLPATDCARPNAAPELVAAPRLAMARSSVVPADAEFTPTLIPEPPPTVGPDLGPGPTLAPPPLSDERGPTIIRPPTTPFPPIGGNDPFTPPTVPPIGGDDPFTPPTADPGRPTPPLFPPPGPTPPGGPGVPGVDPPTITLPPLGPPPPRTDTPLLPPGGPGLEPPRPPGAVPEPATWAMLVIGFGAIGGMIRRRARAQASSSMSQ